VRGLRRWEVQNYRRQRGVYRLRGWDVLGEHGRDACFDVSDVSGKLELAECELGSRYLHV
jgi:hypothetical protein